MAAQSRLTARAEEYLEAILNMRMEGNTVLAARLAERLMVSPPTVAGALSRLKRDGLISLNARKEIGLTAKGEREAISIVRKHRLVERLLTDVLDVEWSECHDEACRIEHGISPTVERKLSEHLGRPATCPHGNPIPTDKTVRLPKAVPLDSVSQGTRIKVVRITEEATRNVEFMRFLQRHAILPGNIFEVKEVATYAGTITLASELEEISLGIKTAPAIWVIPLTD
ncbi:MAG: metal-dependent transcriptional regulator [Planctomycetota bacterium]